MKTRHLEPGAERIAFRELSDSVLEGVAGGRPEKKQGVDAARLRKNRLTKEQLAAIAELTALLELASDEPVYHIWASK